MSDHERAPSVSRLWPETESASLEDVLDGTADDDRRDARTLGANLRERLNAVFWPL